MFQWQCIGFREIDGLATVSMSTVTNPVLSVSDKSTENTAIYSAHSSLNYCLLVSSMMASFKSTMCFYICWRSNIPLLLYINISFILTEKIISCIKCRRFSLKNSFIHHFSNENIWVDLCWFEETKYFSLFKMNSVDILIIINKMLVPVFEQVLCRTGTQNMFGYSSSNKLSNINQLFPFNFLVYFSI